MHPTEGSAGNAVTRRTNRFEARDGMRQSVALEEMALVTARPAAGLAKPDSAKDRRERDRERTRKRMIRQRQERRAKHHGARRNVPVHARVETDQASHRVREQDE